MTDTQNAQNTLNNLSAEGIKELEKEPVLETMAEFVASGQREAVEDFFDAPENDASEDMAVERRFAPTTSTALPSHSIPISQLAHQAALSLKDRPPLIGKTVGLGGHKLETTPGGERLTLNWQSGDKVVFEREGADYTVRGTAPRGLAETGLMELKGERNRAFAYEKADYVWRTTDAAEALRCYENAVIMTNFTAALDDSLNRGLAQNLWRNNDIASFIGQGKGEYETRQNPTMGRDDRKKLEGKPFSVRLMAFDASNPERSPILAGQLLAVKGDLAAVLVPRTDTVVLVSTLGKWQESLRNMAPGDFVEFQPKFSKNADTGRTRFEGVGTLRSSWEGVMEVNQRFRDKALDTYAESMSRRTVELVLEAAAQGTLPEIKTPDQLAKGDIAGRVQAQLLEAVIPLAKELMAQGRPLTGPSRLAGLVEASPLYAVAEEKAYEVLKPDSDQMKESLQKHYVDLLASRASSRVAAQGKEGTRSIEGTRVQVFQVSLEQYKAIPNPAAWIAKGEGREYKGGLYRATPGALAGLEASGRG